MAIKPNDLVAWKNDKNGNIMVDYYSSDARLREMGAKAGVSISFPVLLMTAEELEEKTKSAVFQTK